MIVLDKPQITDLFIPRTGCADAAIKKGCFNRKDIMTLLSNYITVESATTILDEIFVDYISGDNNLTELILNAVGDVYTREQVDTMISGLQAKIDDLQEQIDSMTGYTPTPDTGDTPTPDTGDTPTPDSGLTPDFSGNAGRNKYFTLEPIDDDTEFQFFLDYGDQLSFMYRINEGSWTEAHFTESITVPAGSKMEMKGNNYKYEGSRIWANSPFKVSGNIFSLVYGDDLYAYGFDVNGFKNFFAGSAVVDASELYLGDRNFGVPAWGYSRFFAGCGWLTAAPELPMNGIDQYGFYQMFYGCSSLEKAPVLPSENGAGEQAYTEMFWGCSNLHYINCNLRGDTSNITYNWVGGNVIPSDGVFIGSPDANWKTGNNGVPDGWAYYEYDLEASTNYISTDLDGGEITFTISSNSYWTIDFEDDWFTINRVRGQEGDGITLRVTIPAGDTTRIGVLRISNTYKTIEIPVVRSDQRFVFFDDFPDGTSEDWGYTTSYDPDFVSEFYGYDNINQYLDHYFDFLDNESLDGGVNMYALIGSMEFNNKTYWVYQYMTEWGRFGDESNTNMTYALLDVTRTDIRSKSLRADHNNIYQHYNCFDHFLGTDGTEYDTIPEKEGADIYVIVDVQ